MLGVSKNSMEILLVNLKVLSKIECGDRLYACKKCLEIDKSKGFFNSFWRWFKEESREKTLIEIHNNLDIAFTCIENVMSMYYYTKNDKDLKLLNLLLDELDKTREGLKKLKRTYSNDATLESKLEVEIQLIIKNTDVGRKFLDECGFVADNDVERDQSSLSNVK